MYVNRAYLWLDSGTGIGYSVFLPKVDADDILAMQCRVNNKEAFCLSLTASFWRAAVLEDLIFACTPCWQHLCFDSKNTHADCHEYHFLHAHHLFTWIYCITPHTELLKASMIKLYLFQIVNVIRRLESLCSWTCYCSFERQRVWNIYASL